MAPRGGRRADRAGNKAQPRPASAQAAIAGLLPAAERPCRARPSPAGAGSFLRVSGGGGPDRRERRSAPAGGSGCSTAALGSLPAVPQAETAAGNWSERADPCLPAPARFCQSSQSGACFQQARVFTGAVFLEEGRRGLWPAGRKCSTRNSELGLQASCSTSPIRPLGGTHARRHR